MAFAARVAMGLKRRLRPPRPRGASLAHDLRGFLDMASVRTVVDVGANAGQSAELFHGLFPQAQVVSIEPVAAAYLELQARCRAWPRVRCLNLAVGEAERDVEINTFGISQLNSIASAADATGVERVRMETLEGLSRRLRLPPIDFLKVDVEGYELQVIAGAGDLLTRGQVPLVLIEAGVDDSNARFVSTERLRAALGRCGYEVYAFYDQSHWEPHGKLLYMNVLFVSRAILADMQRTPPDRRVLVGGR